MVSVVRAQFFNCSFSLAYKKRVIRIHSIKVTRTQGDQRKKIFVEGAMHEYLDGLTLVQF